MLIHSRIPPKPYLPQSADDVEGNTLIIDYESSPHQLIMDDWEGSGVPARIMSICLPYVVLKPASQPDAISTVDVRRYKLCKADEHYVNVFKSTYNLGLMMAKGEHQPQPWPVRDSIPPPESNEE